MAPSAPRRTPRLLKPFRSRAYSQLWSSQLLSHLGDGVFYVALVHAMVIGRGSAVDLGLVLGLRSLVGILTIAYGGVVSDRFRRTRVMAVADLVRGAAVLGLVFVPAEGPLWVWIALTCAVGAGGGLFRPAYSAVIPTFLVDGDLESGNALKVLGARLAAVLGPVLGAAVITAGGSEVAFAANTVTYAVSLIMLLGIAEPRIERDGLRTSVAREAWHGVRAVWERPWITATIVSGTVQVLFVLAPMTIFLPIVLDERGQVAWFGILTASTALGSVLGMAVAAHRRPTYPGAAAMLGTLTLSFALACYLVPVPMWLFVVAMVVNGLGPAMFIVYWPAALQRSVPPHLRGRVFALDEMGAFLFQPVGLMLAPLMVTAFGLHLPVLLAIAMLFLTALLPLAVPGVARFADTAPDTTSPGWFPRTPGAQDK
ncbi:MFS transporter [Nocardiopsis sp. CA-288880]|uniref:MFS transporter n=1 Tax=Nocardiopsis sp. CA-288880 TaxID=3239995 RepID=UPI003D95FCF7